MSEEACPEPFVALAARLADASGAIIRRYFRTGLTVDDKPDLSPVTAADRETETALRRLIGEAFPDHGVIGEEYPAERPDAEHVWVLDPIDGTKSFVTGRPLFGTLIGLVRRGVPILGVIDHPALGERWIGAAGRPTTLNGRAVRVRPCPALDRAALFASSPHMFEGPAGAAFDQVRRRARQVVYGSDCYHYGLVASGFGDLAIEAGMGLHDYIAAAPVIQGAGGIMTDWHGAALTTASGDRVIAAGDPRVHEQALEILAEG